jgi:hypothetical protein
MKSRRCTIFARYVFLPIAAALVILIWPLPLRAGEKDPWKDVSKTQANPNAVKAVAAGARDTASAAWWGFDPNDSTQALQAAINSKARTVLVPNMGKPWIVRPLKLRSNLELILADGAEIVAKKGEFMAPSAYLMSAANAENLTLRGLGKGATLRMRKRDYAKPPYPKAEWRSGVVLLSCTNVTIQNLTIASTGGDGIYIGVANGAHQPYCKDVVVRNVICEDNYRQGISVISADGLTIEDCVFRGTSGTAPAAGLDLEPNRANERLKDVMIRRCVSEDNEGWGFLLNLAKLDDPKETPISIRYEECQVRGIKAYGVGITGVLPSSPKGQIAFTNCRIDDTGKAGLYLFGKSADGARLHFEDCAFSNVANETLGSGGRTPSINAPIILLPRRPALVPISGGIAFQNCRIVETRHRPVLLWRGKDANSSVRDISGTILVEGPGKPMMDLGNNRGNIHLILKKAGEN